MVRRRAVVVPRLVALGIKCCSLGIQCTDRLKNKKEIIAHETCLSFLFETANVWTVKLTSITGFSSCSSVGGRNVGNNTNKRCVVSLHLYSLSPFSSQYNTYIYNRAVTDCSNLGEVSEVAG